MKSSSSVFDRNIEEMGRPFVRKLAICFRSVLTVMRNVSRVAPDMPRKCRYTCRRVESPSPVSGLLVGWESN